MKYVAEDGKVFETDKECLKYEARLEKEKAAIAKKKAEKEARWKEVMDAFDKFADLQIAYFKDYPKTKSRISSCRDVDKLLDDLFGDL